jgi:uncharacterized phage protein (TIGR01671 family)
MREVKFRAFQKQSSLNRRPGIYQVKDIIWYDEPFEPNDEEIYRGEVFFKGFDDSEYLEDIILMQYTGLKDKNGVDVFEGDILRLTTKAPHVDVVVEWDEEYAGFTTSKKDHTHMFGSHLCEVIGNIYETPELLTNKPKAA